MLAGNIFLPLIVVVKSLTSGLKSVLGVLSVQFSSSLVTSYSIHLKNISYLKLSEVITSILCRIRCYVLFDDNALFFLLFRGTTEVVFSTSKPYDWFKFALLNQCRFNHGLINFSLSIVETWIVVNKN